MMMEEVGKRTIRCTEHNVGQFRDLVKSCPRLTAMVKGLQAQGVFPGLRGMTITLEGTPEHLARGLNGWKDCQPQATPATTPATAAKGPQEV